MLKPGRDICQETNLRHAWVKSVGSATTTRDGLKETQKVSADPPYELPMLIIFVGKGRLSEESFFNEVAYINFILKR